MIRTTTITPQQALQRAREAHEHAVGSAHSVEALNLLRARDAVAQQFPGCATAILSADSAVNWDRGSYIRAEIDRISTKTP